LTVAESGETSGVVTRTPQGAILSVSVVMSHVCRKIPEPEYHRLFGCWELSTRTAITLGAEPKFRYGEMS
jgi:hypothetical protein